ncbi:HPP family protein [Methylopila sp. M107]|uniref:HPP family protein n=1 Tax=Methylopila sp. M107 TaxID=1101190 RepID=UPI0003799F1F|nr:HPP family protein [Methylopila sp. M107]
MKALIAGLLPDLPPMALRERARAACGALLGILLTGLICRAALPAGAPLPALIAPMGASAVLLFAVPASPLAQPWSILGGNLVSALVGVTAAALVRDPMVAAALAIGGAIALMASLRCIHPPSGAIALTAVLGGQGIVDLGYAYVAWPVAANSVALLALAVAYNNVTGRAYPHRPKPIAGAGDARAGTGSLVAQDIDAAIDQFGEMLDIDRQDLRAILRQAEIIGFRRRSGQTRCADVMTRDVIGIAPSAPLADAFDLLRAHHVKALPVTDEKARVVGIVTQTDLLDKTAWGDDGPRLGLSRRLRLTIARGRAPAATVEDIMTAPVRTATPDQLIAGIVPLMTTAGLHHLPVVEPDGRLAGMIAQSDLILAILTESRDRDMRLAD